RAAGRSGGAGEEEWRSDTGGLIARLPYSRGIPYGDRSTTRSGRKDEATATRLRRLSMIYRSPSRAVSELLTDLDHWSPLDARHLRRRP
ncbi:hypothetical protein PENTCL1PPCAC_7651, partial [Pristionchus entomophagus]